MFHPEYKNFYFSNCRFFSFCDLNKNIGKFYGKLPGKLPDNAVSIFKMSKNIMWSYLHYRNNMSYGHYNNTFVEYDFINNDLVDWTNLTDMLVISLFGKRIDKEILFDFAVCPEATYLFATFDFNKMKNNCQPFSEELVKYVFHPTRLIHLANTFDLSLDEYLDFI